MLTSPHLPELPANVDKADCELFVQAGGLPGAARPHRQPDQPAQAAGRRQAGSARHGAQPPIFPPHEQLDLSQPASRAQGKCCAPLTEHRPISGLRPFKACGTATAWPVAELLPCCQCWCVLDHRVGGESVGSRDMHPQRPEPLPTEPLTCLLCRRCCWGMLPRRQAQCWARASTAALRTPRSWHRCLVGSSTLPEPVTKARHMPELLPGLKHTWSQQAACCWQSPGRPPLCRDPC